MKRNNLISMFLTAAVSLLMATSVFGADMSSFTGWSIEGGRPVYYQNGVILTNTWVLYGDLYYFVDANGAVDANRVISKAAAAESGVLMGYVDTNSQPVAYETKAAEAAAAANNVYAGISDYEAFKTLHPEIVALYPGNEQALYGHYLSTYNGTGITPFTVYRDAVARYEYGLYNTHHYTFRYEYAGGETHRAYCACGEYVVENCTFDAHHGRCSVCEYSMNGLDVSEEKKSKKKYRNRYAGEDDE